MTVVLWSEMLKLNFPRGKKIEKLDALVGKLIKFGSHLETQLVKRLKVFWRCYVFPLYIFLSLLFALVNIS